MVPQFPFFSVKQRITVLRRQPAVTERIHRAQLLSGNRQIPRQHLIKHLLLTVDVIVRQRHLTRIPPEVYVEIPVPRLVPDNLHAQIPLEPLVVHLPAIHVKHTPSV